MFLKHFMGIQPKFEEIWIQIVHNLHLLFLLLTATLVQRMGQWQWVTMGDPPPPGLMFVKKWPGLIGLTTLKLHMSYIH